MFAGMDTESVLSEPSTPRICRSKSAIHHGRNRLNTNSQDPFLDPDEVARRELLREEEFGWSGSVSGIRGRDDRQIERDAEYERKMEERTRKRHERKLARQQQQRQPQVNSSTSTARQSTTTVSSGPPPYESATGGRRRPVFASTELDLQRNNQASSSRNQPDTSPEPNNNLTRGKSIREKVTAALGRFNSISRSRSMARSKSVSALDTPPAQIASEDRSKIGRKQTLIRKLSKKITIEDQDRRRKEREEKMYAEPPLLSHTLVGAASPFPMRPALSSLVQAETLRYGEAHTDYSPSPYRRRRNMSDTNSFRPQPPENCA